MMVSPKISVYLTPGSRVWGLEDREVFRDEMDTDWALVSDSRLAIFSSSSVIFVSWETVGDKADEVERPNMGDLDCWANWYELNTGVVTAKDRKRKSPVAARKEKVCCGKVYVLFFWNFSGLMCQVFVVLFKEYSWVPPGV